MTAPGGEEPSVRLPFCFCCGLLNVTQVTRCLPFKPFPTREVFSSKSISDNLTGLDGLKRGGRARGRHFFSYSSKDRDRVRRELAPSHPSSRKPGDRVALRAPGRQHVQPSAYSLGE